MLQERELRPDMTINSGRGENERKGNKENGISDVGRKKGCTQVNDRNQSNKYE